MVWARRIGGSLLALAGLVALVLAVLDSQVGHRLVADQIGDLKPANGLRYTVGRIEGSLYSDAVLIDVRVADPAGTFLTIPRAELDWRPFAWLSNRLAIERLVAPQATLLRTPNLIPSTTTGPILPDFDIAIGDFRVERLIVARAVTGVVRGGRIAGRADIRAGRAMIELSTVVAGSDRLSLKLDAAPAAGRFDIEVHARGIAGGLLARFSGIRRPLSIDVTGDGDWQAWRGSAVAQAGGTRLLDLALINRAGTYRLSGALTPGDLLSGAAPRLAAGRLNVAGEATYANRRLTGTLGLRSTAVATELTGAIDLAANAWRNVRISARLARPEALIDGLSGRNIAARAILDGAFNAPSFDYRISADRAAVREDGLEQLQITGRGRLARQPWRIPLTLTAARLTGSGDVAGQILRNLSVTGALRIGDGVITGEDLRLKSDKLVSTIDLLIDLKSGSFEIGLNGRLGRYLIPGIGLVDVTSKLRVVPGPDGRGTRVVGSAVAQVLRLDNAFFAGLTGGLPRITTGLERGRDGILYLRGLRLTSPALTLTADGYRRRDKTFHIEGRGTQARYGPVSLVLDGQIERPTVDLVLARPADALGLANVRARLVPSATGYEFRATGGSTLGPFTAAGAILLPKGPGAAIRVDALDVSGTRASGLLQIVAGGFDGRWTLAGGGLSGELLFRPVGAVQRIEGHIAAAGARLGTAASVRRGRLDFVTLLDPAGVQIDATATATALRSGPLTLARFAGNVKLRGGVGEARASIAGSRGRAFDIQTVVQIAPERYSVIAQGTVDRRPLRLTSPAVITREGNGWRLAPTQLSFAGGEARIGGLFGGGRWSVDGGLTRMPLAILDIGAPGLGLGGTATGTVSISVSGAASEVTSIGFSASSTYNGYYGLNYSAMRDGGFGS
ncbi:MAG: translocation/assembly module TamB, partial [Pseudomonadota bacterium]